MIRTLVDRMSAAAGAALVSVIRHGPMPERRRDPYHLLVVVQPADIETLHKIGLVIDAERKHVLAEPVIFTPAELHDSLDVFPLEFVQMQALPYDVLHGEDVLKAIHIEPHDLRVQLHEDVKTKRVWLRQSFVLSVRNARAVAELPATVFPSLLPVLRGALHLRGHAVPVRTEELVATAASTFGLDGPLMRDLNSGVRPSGTPEEVLTRYIELLDHLIEQIGPDGPPQ